MNDVMMLLSKRLSKAIYLWMLMRSLVPTARVSLVGRKSLTKCLVIWSSKHRSFIDLLIINYWSHCLQTLFTYYENHIIIESSQQFEHAIMKDSNRSWIDQYIRYVERRFVSYYPLPWKIVKTGVFCKEGNRGECKPRLQVVLAENLEPPCFYDYSRGGGSITESGNCSIRFLPERKVFLIL